MPINRTLANYISSNPSTASINRASGVWTLDEHGSALVQNTWPIPPNVVQRSLRFNTADSAYLNRTFTTVGNRKKWTYSVWVKRNKPGTGAMLLTAESGSNNDEYHYLWIDSDNIYGLIGIVGANPHIFRTTAVLRDPSAWFHMVSIFDTDNSVGADRWQIWINGIKQSLTVTSTMSQGFASGWVNNNNKHYVGRRDNYSLGYNSDFQLTEINFVDGQALEPSNFGETDPQTGIWIPKPYLGTYGTNGFRLNFSNNSSTTALGYDSSGNGNNWTPNNFSVASGSGNDSLVDVPSLYGVDTGLGGEVRGNYATLNPIDVQSSVTLTNSNLDLSGGDNIRATLGSFGSGKYYYEGTKTNASASPNFGHFGIASSSVSIGSMLNASVLYRSDGNVYVNNSNTTTYASYTTNDVIGVAINCDTSEVSFYKNNTFQGTISFPSGITASNVVPAARNNSGQTSTFNFGQRPWAYQAPSGFKALCTTNLSAPAVGQTSDNQADNHFDAIAYIGNGNSNPGQFIPLGFRPDFVWIKERNTTEWHQLYDVLRGTNAIFSNTDNQAELALDGVTLTSTGVYVKDTARTNENTQAYIMWAWKAGGTGVNNTAGSIASVVSANPAAGFSIVKYTGNATNGATVGHGLGAVPHFIIAKNLVLTSDNPGRVYHRFTGPTKYLNLSGTTGASIASTIWNDTTPNSNVFYLGNNSAANGNGNSHIAYCFTEIPGYSSIGSFVHNASADGAFVYTGFRPKFVLMKGNGVSNWMILDSAKDPTNFMGRESLANLATAESSPNVTYSSDFLSNGFKLRNQGLNDTFIYIAFAETPTRLATAR